METFREDWEAVLDGLEKESAHLLVCYSAYFLIFIITHWLLFLDDTV